MDIFCIERGHKSNTVTCSVAGDIIVTEFEKAGRGALISRINILALNQNMTHERMVIFD